MWQTQKAKKTIVNKETISMSLDPSPGIVIDNERKIFFDVPGIHLYWKYRQGRKYPLKELTVDDVLKYFKELIIDRDIELYNKLLRR